jgi:putative thiamine transport system permease protein
VRRLGPWLTLALFLLPVAAGLAGTLLPAFDWLPALGHDHLGLAPWRALLAAPGLRASLLATLVSGGLGTLLALLLAVLILAALHDRPALRAVRALLAPLLALPHLVTALGLAFLVAPSGWLARLASPWLTGWRQPPDLLLVNDPLGLTLALGLGFRETCFLLFVLLAAETRLGLGDQLEAGRTLGCGRAEAWLVLALPQLWPSLRLPLMAVLAYGLGNVEMALVLGPAAPPTLAPLLLRWSLDPDLSLRFQAAAGALLLLGLVLAVILMGWLAERLIRRHARALVWGKAGGWPLRLAEPLGWAALGLLLAFGAGTLLVLALWSLAGPWQFPAALPARLVWSGWAEATASLAGPIATTLGLAVASAAVATALALATLGTPWSPASAWLRLLYLPLIVPQIAFLFGLQILLLLARLDGGLPGVMLAHLVFVLPYTLLVLEEPWRRLDPGYALAARSLGHGPWSVFWRVELPLLRRTVLTAFAIGFGVSVAQYLPTVFAGAGRVATLMTETLALAGGTDRRLAALAGFWLALLPLLALAPTLLLHDLGRQPKAAPTSVR